MYICQRAATGTHLPAVAMAEWRNGRSWLRDPDDDDYDVILLVNPFATEPVVPNSSENQAAMGQQYSFFRKAEYAASTQ